MNVLVVDDAKVMRNIVINAIKEHYKGELNIVEASDGIEALEKMNAGNINLVCIDWNMPRLDGLEFVKKIRNINQFKLIPILMITSEAARYMILDAVKAGVTDYIVKPIVGEKLWNKLKIHFQQGTK